VKPNININKHIKKKKKTKMIIQKHNHKQKKKLFKKVIFGFNKNVVSIETITKEWQQKKNQARININTRTNEINV
jgi:hypothetical protein